MTLGVCISCTPALAQTVRQTLPHLHALQLRLSSRFSLSGKSRPKLSLSDGSRYHKTEFRNNNKPTFNFDSGVESVIGSRDSNDNYELCVPKPVAKFITRGTCDQGLEEDGIYLRYDWQQESHATGDDIDNGFVPYGNQAHSHDHHAQCQNIV